MNTHLAIFPDTNVFLHYPRLSQIDWRKECNSEFVQIVICMEVIHELDRKKSDPLLSERAQSAIKDIREIVFSNRPVRDGVTLATYDHEPRREDFPTGVSPDRGDDTIIHLVKTYARTGGAERVAIVAEDLGMELRCKVHNIDVVRLDGRLRLPDPKDERTKRFHRTASELAELKSRLPDLKVTVASFPDGAHDREVAIQLDPPPPPLDVAEVVAKIREAYPKRGVVATAGVFGNPLYWDTMNPSFIPEDEIDRYNRELDSFYEKFGQYVELTNQVDEGKSRLFRFSLVLKNSGKGPASDVKITLSFPDRFTFLAAQDSKDARMIEAGVTPPDPPTAPRTNGELWESSRAYMRAMPSPISRIDPLALFRREDKFEVRVNGTPDQGNFSVEASLGRAVHTREYTLGGFVAILKSRDDIGTFSVPYQISAAECPSLIEGELLFRISTK